MQQKQKIVSTIQILAFSGTFLRHDACTMCEKRLGRAPDRCKGARVGVSLRSNLNLIEIRNFLLLFDPFCHYIRAVMAVTNQQKGTSSVLVRIDRSGAAPDPTKRVGCYFTVLL